MQYLIALVFKRSVIEKVKIFGCLVCFLLCYSTPVSLDAQESPTQVSVPAESPTPFTTPTPTETPAPEQKTTNEEDLVHFGDVIDVDVVGSFEFDWHGTLNSDGFLDGLQNFGEPVLGLCRSETQISTDIVNIYIKILRDPKVDVKIIDRSKRALAQLDGGVRTPSRFRLLRRARLLELLVMSGGLTDEASGDITILRPKGFSCQIPGSTIVSNEKKMTAAQDNAPEIINIKIQELLEGKPNANPWIKSGDLITVTRALPIYIIGAVTSPRPIYARADLVLTRAIATAGGLSKDADEHKVSIFRKVDGETKIIVADLERIKLGESEDEILKPFDIIEIASKGGGKRKYPPIDVTAENKDRSFVNLPIRIVD